MIVVDTAAAAVPGVVGGANAALNGILGLYIAIQTLARFVPTLKHSEINHWFGKILNYVFLYSKTYTKSGTGESEDVAAPDTVDATTCESDVAVEVPTSSDTYQAQSTSPESALDSAGRALSAAADAVVAASKVVINADR